MNRLRFFLLCAVLFMAADASAQQTIQGAAAHDATLVGRPILIGCASSAAAPTSVSADTEAVRLWCLRNGAAAVVITAGGALISGDAANGVDVDVTRLPALVAGDADVGNVDLELAGTAVSATNPVAVRFSDGSAFVTPDTQMGHNVAVTRASTTGGALICTADADGDNTDVTTERGVLLNCDLDGSLYVKVLTTALPTGAATAAKQSADPCTTGTKLFIAISQTTDTQLLAGTASNRTYVCGFMVTQAAASTQTFALVSGTGTVCGTSVGPLIGGTTACSCRSTSAGRTRPSRSRTPMPTTCACCRADPIDSLG
jgi:hypothetical protein